MNNRIKELEAIIPWANEMESYFKELQKSARVGYSLYTEIQGEKLILARTETVAPPMKQEEPKPTPESAKPSKKTEKPKLRTEDETPPPKRDREQGKGLEKREEPSKPKNPGNDQ